MVSKRMQNLIIIFIIVQLLDLISTLIGILDFGFKEANTFMIQFGVNGMIVMKLVGIILCVTLLLLREMPWRIVVAVICFTAIFPIYNFGCILYYILLIKGVL